MILTVNYDEIKFEKYAKLGEYIQFVLESSVFLITIPKSIQWQIELNIDTYLSIKAMIEVSERYTNP